MIIIILLLMMVVLIIKFSKIKKRQCPRKSKYQLDHSLVPTPGSPIVSTLHAREKNVEKIREPEDEAITQVVSSQKHVLVYLALY